MTTTLTTVTPAGARLAPTPNALADAMVIAKRHLLAYSRQPELLVFVFVQPVMFVLLFRYVFGGAISNVPGGRYVDFLMPGIITQTVGFGAMNTAIAMADDLQKGIIDRFRSLPMSRVAVVAGRVLADVARLAVTITIMVLVGLLVGWRLQGGGLHLVWALLLALGFGQAMSWATAFMGLSVPNPEAAQAAGFVCIFPLSFASSVFVPVSSMPGWLQAFARINPITLVATSLRNLTMGRPVGDSWWQALLWIAGITLVAGAASVRKYKRVA
jgi:ABC transporter DrrB family efflux protein